MICAVRRTCEYVLLDVISLIYYGMYPFFLVCAMNVHLFDVDVDKLQFTVHNIHERWTMPTEVYTRQLKKISSNEQHASEIITKKGRKKNHLAERERKSDGSINVRRDEFHPSGREFRWKSQVFFFTKMHVHYKIKLIQIWFTIHTNVTNLLPIDRLKLIFN